MISACRDTRAQAWAPLFLEHGGTDGGIRESGLAGRRAAANPCCMRPVEGIKPECVPFGTTNPWKALVSSRMRLENDASARLLSTEEAAERLGVKRQQFQVLARFFGLRPVVQRRLGASRTPVNLYDADAIGFLVRLARRCRDEGARRVLESLASEPGLR